MHGFRTKIACKLAMADKLKVSLQFERTQNSKHDLLDELTYKYPGV